MCVGCVGRWVWGSDDVRQVHSIRLVVLRPFLPTPGHHPPGRPQPPSHPRPPPTRTHLPGLEPSLDHIERVVDPDLCHGTGSSLGGLTIPVHVTARKQLAGHVAAGKRGGFCFFGSGFMG